MKTIKYKNFVGSAEISFDDNCLHGKILFINDLVTYQADNITALKNEFEAAVDDYIETCKSLEIKPQKSFSGTFNIRVGEELHKEAALYAVQNDFKINAVIIQALEKYLHESKIVQEIHNHIYNHTYNLSFEEPSEKLISDNEAYIIEDNVTATLAN